MPKKLRYNQVLGLNSRGLSRHRKRQIVWKTHVRNNPRLQRNITIKHSGEKRKDLLQNEYWDEFHSIQKTLKQLNIKGFENNPSIIISKLCTQSFTKSDKYHLLKKLRSLQLKIENLKCKYSVAIPNKRAIKCLQILSKGQGIIEAKTSNHNNGYWLYLIQNLYQKNAGQNSISFQCKIFNACKKRLNVANDGLLKSWDHKKKNRSNKKNKRKLKLAVIKASLTKSRKRKENYLPIMNSFDVGNEGCKDMKEILQEYQNYILLFIYPDFEFDFNVLNDKYFVNNSGNEKRSMDNHQFSCFGSVTDGCASVQCLKAFTGEYIVHVGELFGKTFDAKNVWGRTTSMAFQVELQSNFHCISEMTLPHWPLFRDSMSIWRKNKTFQLGSEVFLSFTDQEINVFDGGRNPDVQQTKYFRNIYQQRLKSKKSRSQNIFEGANYAENERVKWKSLDKIKSDKEKMKNQSKVGL